jgi:hypothetical protein
MFSYLEHYGEHEMDRHEASPASKLLNSTSITVVGRFETSAGCIADFVLEGRPDLKANGDFEGGRLVQRTTDLAKAFPQRRGRALAFVGVGFCPAPMNDFDRLLWKAEFDESKHPRVPEGTPKGGEFCSAGEASDADAAETAIDGLNNQNAVMSDLTKKVEERITRRILRNRLIAALRIFAAIGADAVPFAGEVLDAYEIAQILEDGVALERDITAARAFVRSGPKALEDLYADTVDKPFKSFDAFKKTEFEKVYGPAGDGYEYHHIVEQASKEGNIPAEVLHSTSNIVKIPKLIHEAISAKYSEIYENTGKTLRDWLRTQPYEVQRAKGLEIMHEFRIIK